MPKSGLQRVCRNPHCGRTFHDPPGTPHGQWSRFCSHDCRISAKVAATNRGIIRSLHPRAHRVPA